MPHPNENLIQSFYEAFDSKNYKVMQDCYADDATFYDPVFQSLNAVEVKAMWEMLLTSAKDLRVVVTNVKANDTSGSCRWDAYYTFSATGRPVHNIIDASFEFRNGKIVKHTDRFDLYRWCRMALGFSAILLGWTPFMQNAVRRRATSNLDRFMKKPKET